MSGRGVARNVPLKSDNSPVATYKCDAAGSRVEKAVNGGATERYVLSRAEQTSNGIDCWHVIAVFVGSNNWKQNFVCRDEIDGVVALEQKDVLDFDTDGNTTETTRNFCHANALGSVMAISDMTQATAASYRCDPYGKVTITPGGSTQTTDPLGQHWGFMGRFLDEETRHWHYRARYYNPGTRRFVQRDPLGYRTGPNLFAYASSSPTTRNDPSGQGDPPASEFASTPPNIGTAFEPCGPPADPREVWDELYRAAVAKAHASYQSKMGTALRRFEELTRAYDDALDDLKSKDLPELFEIALWGAASGFSADGAPPAGRLPRLHTLNAQRTRRSSRMQNGR